MLIDFSKIEKLIPEKGTLVLRFRKMDKGLLQVSCAPIFAGKKVPNHPAKGEQENVALAVSPVTYEDTALNFNAQYEQTITEILGQKAELLALSGETNRSIAVSGAKKKEELRKAIEKKGGASKASENPGSKDGSLSLFGSGKNSKEEKKTEGSAEDKDKKEDGQGPSDGSARGEGGSGEESSHTQEGAAVPEEAVA